MRAFVFIAWAIIFISVFLSRTGHPKLGLAGWMIGIAVQLVIGAIFLRRKLAEWEHQLSS